MRFHRPVAGSNAALAALRSVLPSGKPPNSRSRPSAQASSGEFRSPSGEPASADQRNLAIAAGGGAAACEAFGPN